MDVLYHKEMEKRIEIVEKQSNNIITEQILKSIEG